ncbi:hypothetical protein MVQ24_10440, partial [Fusobacterium necrophorum]|nr:hypothetical protein [Fusobacterium necrophorum]
GACADIYGVGDAIAVSKSYPCFGGVYKIVELDGKPLIKLSEEINRADVLLELMERYSLHG